MIDVIPNELGLGITDGLFDRTQLWRDFSACSARLDHRDNAAKVTFGTAQPLDDTRMALVRVSVGVIFLVIPGNFLLHARILRIPHGGLANRG